MKREDFCSMNILLTGGAGFIGSHTAVELLNAGHHVIVVDNLYNSSEKVIERVEELTGKKVRFYNANACDFDAMDKIFAENPGCRLSASGLDVGLPEGQMGNSEVGHTNMGAGRIVYQQLTLITKSIKDGEMLKNPVLVKNMKAAIDAGKAIHLMGLVGTGGVHSHADHWYGVLEMAKHLGAKDVYLHCIMDGRDTDPHSGKGFLADLQAKLDELGIGKIASVSGRYYAMDRDNNWDREEKAYAAFVYGEGNHAANAAEAIEASYAADVTDEFVVPVVTICLCAAI